ncbi:bifunctional 4-hydroxy-2-oxoglutarate aldolase/2-dehydro-3-deoxy-phosphogluconate aldolase [Pseudomaricurvus sp. HS19]|uniref:bifunctional 4-hydroxy-2-oxoglutarate aldolase/2-dehydro-3-deoxy-phosphogluconate aldolase n=1 Tax=Pseudomaricurvus sp. HS19 TaxID=2692626 RepID=UPI0013715BB8|nr:bifunctional 4-hydroxy-2-oxoglutarate aldolase/2-dehydro-3-deoxy-phosphogluconate aldolase [Pseudomaricurvus sp. HS19]MYM61762.1 bifunctional 4-hydroxy-2-oxoglutarate aldolase/2-dehydro-3-deoxy-phosphogluconate aldolase [Pseudomaricurvus sp. HS19]
MTLTTQEIMQLAPVIPVMVIDRAEDAVPLANALVNGGLKVLEITLRTAAALESIRLIKEAVPDAVVGAGTIINVGNLFDSLQAGAEFIVTPGTTTAIVDASVEAGVPLLPGVNTPSEAMTLLERGFDCLKFFPAEAAGGVPMLKAMGGPLPQLRFCPTGGVTPANAASYLSLPNVSCVGGSWMAPADLVRAGNWAEIERLAAEAASLGGKS